MHNKTDGPCEKGLDRRRVGGLWSNLPWTTLSSRVFPGRVGPGVFVRTHDIYLLDT